MASLAAWPRSALSDRGFILTGDPVTGEALDEAEVSELAARLLDARSEAERDHVLAATLTHAAHRAGGALTAPLGRALGGTLKNVAARALDGAGPDPAFGLELEGLDASEREFEAAQRFVRLAGEAARHAAEEGEMGAPPSRMALAALAAAADAFAPALVPAALTPPPYQSGGWARRNGVIEVYRATRPVSPPIGGSLPGSISLPVAEFEYDPEMQYFLGGLVRSVGRTVGKVAGAVSKAADAVGKIPILGDVARAGIGAARLGLGPAAIAIDAGSRLARGQNLGAALKGAVVGQVDAVRDQLKLAEMVAPFIPGIGTGVAAALGAANALAAGRPITEAVLAAARSALPGGAVAQAAFDVALNLAKGKNLGEAALAAARDRLPGGPAARAAFDGAVALAQGKRLQDAAFAAAGRLLPPSPYAADALTFVQRVANGQNIQHAALSTVGQRVIRQVKGNAALAAISPPGGRSAQSAFQTAVTAVKRGNAGLQAVQGLRRGAVAGQQRALARNARAMLPRREMELETIPGPADRREQQEVTPPQPGSWVGNLNAGSGKTADRVYQRQITGRPTHLDYRVERGNSAANFDGYKRGVLLDAKNLPKDGGVVRMWEWSRQNKAPPPERLRAWAEQQLEEARRQIKVAGGVPIVWHVSSGSGARVLRQLLETHGLIPQGGKAGIVVKTTAPQPR